VPSSAAPPRSRHGERQPRASSKRSRERQRPRPRRQRHGEGAGEPDRAAPRPLLLAMSESVVREDEVSAAATRPEGVAPVVAALDGGCAPEEEGGGRNERLQPPCAIHFESAACCEDTPKIPKSTCCYCLNTRPLDARSCHDQVPANGPHYGGCTSAMGKLTTARDPTSVHPAIQFVGFHVSAGARINTPVLPPLPGFLFWFLGLSSFSSPQLQNSLEQPPATPTIPCRSQQPRRYATSTPRTQFQPRRSAGRVSWRDSRSSMAGRLSSSHAALVESTSLARYDQFTCANTGTCLLPSAHRLLPV
jgi:hypothetical protein